MGFYSRPVWVESMYAWMRWWGYCDSAAKQLWQGTKSMQDGWFWQLDRLCMTVHDPPKSNAPGLGWCKLADIGTGWPDAIIIWPDAIINGSLGVTKQDKKKSFNCASKACQQQCHICTSVEADVWHSPCCTPCPSTWPSCQGQQRTCMDGDHSPPVLSPAALY